MLHAHCYCCATTPPTSLAPYCPTCDREVNSLITISLQYSACYTSMSLSSNLSSCPVSYFFWWESLPFHKLQFMLHVLKLNTFPPFCYCISCGFFFSGERRVSCTQCMLHILLSNLSSNTLLPCVLLFCPWKISPPIHNSACYILLRTIQASRVPAPSLSEQFHLQSFLGPDLMAPKMRVINCIMSASTLAHIK